jgi:hypothetical protein
VSWLKIQVEWRGARRFGRIAIAESIDRKRRLTPVSRFSSNNGTDIAALCGREWHEF